MDEIKQLTGDWVHIQDDGLPTFLDAAGSTAEEKQYMVGSTPLLSFKVTADDNIHFCNTPYPESQPDVKADVNFKLGQQFTFEPMGHTFSVVTEWTDGRLIQNMTCTDKSNMMDHQIITHIHDGNLIQIYKLTNAEGVEVKGVRRYTKKTPDA